MAKAAATDELATLEQQHAELTARIHELKRAARADVLTQTKANIRTYGFTLRDLGLQRRGAHDGPAEVAPAKKRRTRKPATSD